jgi:hypothetical protein
MMSFLSFGRFAGTFLVTDRLPDFQILPKIEFKFWFLNNLGIPSGFLGYHGNWES